MRSEDANAAAPRMAGEEIREYRKGNWTLHETVALIAAKKGSEDSERDQKSFRTAELRWKWIENYCWRNGCLRSQNQCNDKWDNLLRDYKKVRDYELRLFPGQKSYWEIEKQERKDRGLPSNLPFQVYEALHEVVIDRRYPPAMADKRSSSNHHHILNDDNGHVLLPPGGGLLPGGVLSGSSESAVQPASGKRRKIMSKSTLELAQTLLACEEKKERRHRDILGLEERKLRIEEAKAEICRKGIAGLINAVNNLASAILALAADRNVSATD